MSLSTRGIRPRARASMAVGWIAAAWLAAPATSGAFLPVPDDDDGARSSGDISRHAIENGAAGGHRTLFAGDRHVHALVLRVAFADTTWDDTVHSTAYFEDLLFGDDSHSLRSYFLEVSGGRFSLTGDVEPVVTLDESIVTYTGDDQCIGCCCGVSPYPYNSQALTEDVVAALDGAVDFSRYDGNGDGEVDVLFVVHAGLGREDTTRPRTFLAHQWHTVQTPVVDGVEVTNYVLTSRFSRVGVFAHEMVHLFGVPDLYDLDRTSIGLGNWSLMAAGALLGTPSASNPARPDAWTQTQLGFASPRTIDGAVASVTLAEGEIARAWTAHRHGAEYFLFEHRSRTRGAFDRELPGEGLLIYHVDETQRSNRTEFRYRVALEQADGRFELEAPVFLNRLGDASDPFPGSEFVTAFHGSTTPSSGSNLGAPTDVAVTDIVADDTSASFTLRVASSPVFDLHATPSRDAGGSEDLRPDPGERWGLDLYIRNRGTDAPPTTWTASGSGGIEIAPGAIDLPEIPAGATLELSEVIEARFLDSDEMRVGTGTLMLDGVTWPEDTIRTEVHFGGPPGVETSFESDDGWSSDPPWHRTTRRADDGAFAYRFGTDGDDAYPPDTDAWLVSPTVWLGAGSTLRVRHWIDAESAPPRDAFDGGRVEVFARGTWTPIRPRGGYSHRAFTNPATILSGVGQVSGEADWSSLEFDLSAWDGEDVHIGFRFATDENDADRSHEGWYLDAVRVETAGDDVAAHVFEPDLTHDAVAGEWTIVPLRKAFEGIVHLIREDVDGTGVPTSDRFIVDSQAVNDRVRAPFSDLAMDFGSSRRYRLVWIDVVPESVLTERIVSRAALPPRPVVLAVGPNPLLPGREFVLELSPSRVRRPDLWVYDVRGRRIARGESLVQANGGARLRWPGTLASGERAPAGVYFYRVEPPIGVTGRVVVWR